MKPILTTTKSLSIIPQLDLKPGEALYLYDKVGEEIQSYHDEALTVMNTLPVISDAFGKLPAMWVNKKANNILLMDETHRRRMVYVGGQS